MLIGLSVVNYLGVRFGGGLQNLVTLVKAGAMAAMLLLVFMPPSAGDFSNLTLVAAQQPKGWAMWTACAGALQGAFWAYEGWNLVASVAGEVKEPQRNLPRALIWGMGLVTLIYLAMNLAYTHVLPIDEMAGSKLVAAEVAERCMTHGGRWVAVAVMVSTFGAANAIILTSARVYFSMGQRGVFPSWLGRVDRRFHTPGWSILVQALWGVALLFSGTFDTLTNTLIFVSLTFYAAAALGVILLRASRAEPGQALSCAGISLGAGLVCRLYRVLSRVDPAQRFCPLLRSGRRRAPGYDQFLVRPRPGVGRHSYLLVLLLASETRAAAVSLSAVAADVRRLSRCALSPGQRP
jgi:APA family basic amino acid/polyamine antiporter